MGTALVVGLLVVMCGGIAYVGDLLGRRMGKKRLSLFGLRPRHTAVVFTVVTGMVIAGVTLGVLLGASAGVRLALTRGEQLLNDNRRLRRERRDLDLQWKRLTYRNSGLESQNAELVKGNETLRAEGTRLRAETGRLRSTNQSLQAKNRQISERNGRLEVRNSALSGQNRRLASDNKTLEGRNRKLATANSGLWRRNRGLQVAQASLTEANQRVQRRLTQAYGDLNTTRRNLEEERKELARTNAAALKVAKDLYRRSEEYRLQAERAAELEVGQVVVRAREELARRVIAPGSSAAEVRRIIEGLLDDADAEVARREGRNPPAGRSGARPRRVRLALPGGPPDRLLEAMVARLMTESHPVNGQPPRRPMPEAHPLVVRALARENAPAGSSDPVEVDVVGKINLLAFRKGQEVALLKEVPTANTTGQLLKMLVAFLQQEVREAAVTRSVLPDGAGRVGEIDPEALLDVVARIKRLPGRATVGAVAVQDTWSAGPLRLDFYVVPAETQVAEKEKP